MTIVGVPASPANYREGRNGTTVDRVVVHVMDGTLRGTDAWFANPASAVSAHYGVGANGEVHRYVPEADTAWHAGDAAMNRRSIGIEHEGRQPATGPAWAPTNAQWMASVALCASACQRHGIDPTDESILRHSTINPAHARCPGPGFDLVTYVADVRRALASAEPRRVPVRLFDPVSNQQIGEGTLIERTDKVYVKRLDGR